MLNSDFSQTEATRTGLGDELTAHADNKDLVVVNADLPSSLKLDKFIEAAPERYIQVGVAEQVMASIGTGLALYGKIPFITSFAAFSPGLNWSQLRLAAMSKANLKVASSHYGLNVGEDGASAQMLEDVALMRTLPNFAVVTPADYTQARQAVRAAIQHLGPIYLRFTRSKYPVIFAEDSEFQIGKAQLLKEGSELTIVATGTMVYPGLQIVEKLAAAGVSAELINLHTVKPLDKETILNSVNKTKRLVTMEEHQIMGGMGSAVLEALAGETNYKSLLLGIEDAFGTSGEGMAVVAEYGLDSESLLQRIRNFLAN
jgi:transketolase